MPDKIDKQIVLHAALDRVWNAIADAQQFGMWFGVAFDGPFVTGTHVTGKIVPTRVDPEVAALQKPHEGKAFAFYVEAIDAMRSISFRWHPFAIDPAIDYSNEPTTLIVFKLEETAEGTRLTISESGFDNIPLERRARAFAANEDGWAKQTTLIAKYLAAAAAV